MYQWSYLSRGERREVKMRKVLRALAVIGIVTEAIHEALKDGELTVDECVEIVRDILTVLEIDGVSIVKAKGDQ